MYTVDDDSFLSVIGKTNHGSGSVPLVRKASDGTLLYVFYINGTAYHVVDMRSGEQKEIPARRDVSDTGDRKLAIEKHADGKFAVRIS